MNTAIKLENVGKSFKKNRLFSNVNLEIAKGSVVGFRGGNGSGKSVLFKIISGLQTPDSGSVYIREQKLGDGVDFPDNMGILIDSPGFIEIFSGFENLRLLAAIQKKIDENRIIEVMTLLGLDHDNKERVKNYSLGMKQKLGIAQAIMENQDIVILDEPFNALDAKSNEILSDLINELRERGTTVLLTSHNQQDLDALCDVQYIVPTFEIYNN